MSELQRYTAGAMLRSPSRQASRTLARIEDGAAVKAAAVEACVDDQARKADGMAAVTQRALQGAAFTSQVEQQLAQLVPLAASRLQAIGDVGALGLSEIVMDTATKLRRI